MPNTLRCEHLTQKLNLKMLEQRLEYKLNNPELIKQRNLVRLLKDKIIEDESHGDYIKNKKSFCTIEASQNCSGKIDHSYKEWVAHGNCCKECSRYINRQTYRLYDTAPKKITSTYVKIMDEFAKLDEQES